MLFSWDNEIILEISRKHYHYQYHKITNVLPGSRDDSSRQNDFIRVIRADHYIHSTLAWVLSISKQNHLNFFSINQLMHLLRCHVRTPACRCGKKKYIKLYEIRGNHLVCLWWWVHLSCYLRITKLVFSTSKGMYHVIWHEQLNNFTCYHRKMGGKNMFNPSSFRASIHHELCCYVV